MFSGFGTQPHVELLKKKMHSLGAPWNSRFPVCQLRSGQPAACLLCQVDRVPAGIVCSPRLWPGPLQPDPEACACSLMLPSTTFVLQAFSWPKYWLWPGAPAVLDPGQLASGRICCNTPVSLPVVFSDPFHLSPFLLAALCLFFISVLTRLVILVSYLGV